MSSINYLTYNDNLISVTQPILLSSNRGLKFGDGIFESMKMQNHELMFSDLHADRIQAAAKFLKFEKYQLLDSYFLKQKTTELSKKNKLNGNSRFRLTVFRSNGGLYTPDTNRYEYILEVMPSTPTYELNTKGLIIDVYSELTKSINKLSQFKTTNALLFVMASIFKKERKLDDVILLNDAGFICESASSNIFVVYKNQIYTPPLSEGCVGGVMRSVVLKLAKENNIDIIEAQINPQILLEAEEVFLTNAALGIRWVMGYGRKRYFNEYSKLLSAKLNQL
ncbi:aminotransferase class IV [Pedobacter flavus]|uniref:branched-chain-amino-acid transaminase n=1 Tax=Pedobacter flavus TaxID=3113906 RepID=A0ABU7GYF8_9SPHI|nr:aminotransferase class IV [Pedobacter sp. VNH31]MEE1883823.1 aminotransferase class IV [Pedobacter sp. VNH31]